MAIQNVQYRYIARLLISLIQSGSKT